MRTILLISILLLNLDCNNREDLNRRRMEVIHQSISLILNYDTSNLYKIVDTSAYFDINEKEGFLSTIIFLKGKLALCGIGINDSNIKIENGLQNADNYITNYMIPFCRDRNGKKLENSFDLVVQFANYQNTDKIMFLKIKNSTDFNKMTPSLPH